MLCGLSRSFLHRLLARIGDVPVGRHGAVGDTFGPFDVLYVPGHADDHLVFVITAYRVPRVPTG